MEHGWQVASHRRRRNGRALVACGGAVVLAVAAAGVWLGVRGAGEESCTGQVRLSVAAAPDIAPVLRSAAEQWAATVRGTCVVVDVAAEEPADVAAAVAEDRGVSLAGLGKANGTVRIPQVWVPDSSLWQQRLQAASPGFQPAGVTSIARSPVVLAVPELVAPLLGWPGTSTTWDSLLDRLRTGSQVRAGIVDPTRDAAGMSGLLAFGQAAARSGDDAEEATVSALRALAGSVSTLRDDLLTRFPDSATPEAAAAALSAAPLTEQSVIKYNAQAPALPLAAVYAAPAPLAMDYPYTVLPGLDPQTAEVAGKLRAELLSDGFRDALGRQGLRGPDGGAGAGFAAPTGAPMLAGPAPASPVPASAPASGSPPAQAGPDASAVAAKAVDQVLDAWLPLTQPGQILAVLDVSGSMLTKVPTAGNLTREQVTVAAAIKGLALFDDSWAIGLWIFSTNLDGARDHRELLPISPMSANRERAGAVLSGIRPKKGGQTGLYDTMLAAYRKAQDEWRPGRLNAVVIMTDGENQDEDGISLSALVTELGKVKDPKRPVDIVAIGIGPDIDAAALRQVIDVTGGGLFPASDPAKIGAIFLRALALHTRSE